MNAATGPVAMGKPTKGRGGWGWLGLIAILTVLPWIILLAWLGLVPGLSDLMGLNEPEDLGVKVSVNDARTFESKSGIQLDKVKRDIFSAAAPGAPGQDKGQTAGQPPAPCDCASKDSMWRSWSRPVRPPICWPRSTRPNWFMWTVLASRWALPCLAGAKSPGKRVWILW